MSEHKGPNPGSDAPFGNSPFAGLELQDFVASPQLIQVLKAHAQNVELEMVKLTTEKRSVQRKLDSVTSQFSKLLVMSERRHGDEGALIARLRESNAALQSQLEAARRLSAIAVVTAWIGAVLAAFGVNILTNTPNSKVGVGMLLAGATLEVLAFFIRRYSTGAPSDTS